MSQPDQPNPPEDPTDRSDADPEHIPLEPEPDRSSPDPAHGQRPILEIADDTCPNCGTSMRESDLVCLSCGYDLQGGTKIKTQTGVVEAPEEPKPQPIFVTEGRGSPSVIAAVGVGLTIAAMIAAGVNATGRGATVTIALVLLVLYRTALHTGTGVLGVWGAAFLRHERFGRIELAGARMFAAFALFQLITNLHLPIGIEWLSKILLFVVGIGAYWLAVFALFRRSRNDTTLILACHFAAWAFVEIGVQLAAWLAAAANSSAT